MRKRDIATLALLGSAAGMVTPTALGGEPSRTACSVPLHSAGAEGPLPLDTPLGLPAMGGTTCGRRGTPRSTDSLGLNPPGGAPPASSAARAKADVPDNTNRDEPRFQPVNDPLVERAMDAARQQLAKQRHGDGPGRSCELPAYDPGWKGDGRLRRYNKYDTAFLAAAVAWKQMLGKEIEGGCLCELAGLMKAVAWHESRIGYASGFHNGGRYPRQPKGWIDTEDVMQVANPLDTPIHRKVEEINQAFDTAATGVPTSYTYRNVSGEQSIFYGTGWFLLKLARTNDKRIRCEPAALRRALVAYNANRHIDRWNGREHRWNYMEAVWTVLRTGTHRSPSTGQKDKKSVWRQSERSAGSHAHPPSVRQHDAVLTGRSLDHCRLHDRNPTGRCPER